MDSRQSPPRRLGRGALLLGFLLAAGPAVLGPAASGEQAKIDVLHIGSSGTLAAEAEAKEKASLDSLRDFIKEETGLSNDINKQKDWRELAEKMSKGKLHVGVFQGYEYAWAQKEYPGLKPLALAVNVHRYPVVYVVAKRDGPVKDFAGLQGKTLSIPATGQPYLRLYAERQAQKRGKKLDAFVAKVTKPENAEVALDDVVDGVTQATVVDQATLEAFKRRKPGRFKQLKEVAKSQPLPPVMVALYDKVVDEATRKKLLDGLLGAAKKEQGEMMLTLFRMTGFETVPDDFAKVLDESRKTYPPPGKSK